MQNLNQEALNPKNLLQRLVPRQAEDVLEAYLQTLPRHGPERECATGFRVVIATTIYNGESNGKENGKLNGK